MSLGVDVNDDEQVFKNFINAQNLINQETGKVKFLKTHSSLVKCMNVILLTLKIL